VQSVWVQVDVVMAQLGLMWDSVRAPTIKLHFGGLRPTGVSPHLTTINRCLKLLGQESRTCSQVGAVAG
jgi:hypothetical protein